MSIERFEQQLETEAPAVHYLNDTIAEFLINRGHAAKIGEIVSQVGKRIGASAKLIRQTMTSNPKFIGEERRWNLTLRTQFHRPLEGALQQALRLFGKPMNVAAFSNEMAVLNARAPEYFQQILPSFLEARPYHFFQLPDERWALREWLLDTNALDEEELFVRNFFDIVDELRPILDKVREVPVTAAMSPADIAMTVLQALDQPLNTKVLSFAVWRVQGADFDPEQFYIILLQDTRLHSLSGGDWMQTEKIPVVSNALQQLSALADVAMEEEETWEGPYTVADEDISEIYDFLVEHGRPQKLSDIIEAVFEYGAASPRFPSVYEGLMAALQVDPRLQLVGRQTWTLPALVPQDVLQVPESLLPEIIDPAQLVDPETDAELEDEGLDDNLAIWVHDPRYEDFGGEHEVELSPEMMDSSTTLDETRIPLLFNHRKMGTLKLRQADMAFFPTDTPLACITAQAEGLDYFQVWINNDELLIHGLAEWYEARQIPVGAVLAIRRGRELDDYIITWDTEVDELIAISPERISDLLTLREQAEEQHLSVYEIMTKVLTAYPEGVHFLTIWAETNVVRRTPKRVVASNLSSYHCFVQVSNSEKFRLDERKIDQGRKKTKKKFVIE